MKKKKILKVLSKEELKKVNGGLLTTILKSTKEMEGSIVRNIS